MYSECLPFTAIPHTSALFRDFLYQFDRVTRFYPGPPNSPEWILRQPGPPSDPELRRRVGDVLVRQNRGWSAGEATLTNAEKLASGARAVVTGQQVGLFGGPAFAVYKALTAIKVAQEFTRAGVECVPIFWLATEDHDFAEINHVTLPAASGLQNVTVSSVGTEGAPVGELLIGKGLEHALRVAGEVFGEGEALRSLRAAYTPGETFGNAFARFMAATFAPHGLVLIDPSDPELHAIAAPIYADAIARCTELNRDVQQRGKELESAGYDQQVKVTAATSFLFALENGVRTPVHRNGDGFEIGGAKISSAGLLRRVESSPHEFTPNALLRSSIQDYLLPTALYIGGPAELAYWAQAAPLQERLLGRVTPVAHRFSATIVEPASERLLKRYNIALPELLAGLDHTRELLARRVLPAELDAEFSRAAEDLRAHVAVLSHRFEHLDRTLVDAAQRASRKMQYQLERLRGRAARAELRRNEEISRHAERLSTALFPNKGLQERTYPGAYFLARYGDSLLSDLLEQVRIECPDHQVIHLAI